MRDAIFGDISACCAKYPKPGCNEIAAETAANSASRAVVNPGKQSLCRATLISGPSNSNAYGEYAGPGDRPDLKSDRIPTFDTSTRICTPRNYCRQH